MSRIWRRLRLSIFPAVVGVLVVAGGAGLTWSSALAASQQTPEGYPADGQPAIVTLASSGAEPRTRLRYRVEKGQAMRMEMTMLMSMSMGMGGMTAPTMAMPLIRIGADIVATDVSASGDISSQMTFTSSTVEPAPGADPAMVAAMQGMAALEGLQGTSTISNRGVTRSMELDLSRVADPQLQQAIGPMAEQFKDFSLPLPEEAVGVGAQWEVRQRQSSSGTLTFQRTEFHVTAIDGDLVTVEIKTEQTAPRQTVNNPALPPEAQVTLQRLNSTGTGTAILNMASLVPTSDASIRSSTVMEIDFGGNSQTVGVDMTMKLTISPGG